MISSTSIEKKVYLPKYCEYELHISEFNDKVYFENKNMNEDPIFDDKIDNFYNFIAIYKKIEEEDLKKSALMHPHKGKKGGLNPSGYSYNLTTYNTKQKVQKAWNSHIPTSKDEKLNGLIESYLNKISDESYKKISIDFMNELIQINDLFYFDIITKKVVDKCVMDNKYQHLYIQLCNKIWSNRQIHYHLAHIKEEQKKYYWSSKYENVNKYHGPFMSEMDAKMNIFHELNFKKYFMNYLQELFIHKNVNFSHIENDEEFFLHKRQFMVIIEILGIMYMEKFMPVDILHIVIMKLFHMNDMNMNIESIEIDGILQIFKIMVAYKEKYKIENYFDLPIFKEYYNYITQIETLNIFNMRTKYFLCDCKDILIGKKGKSSGVQKEAEAEAEVEVKEENLLEKIIQAKEKSQIATMIQLYHKANDETRESITYDILYRFCESKCADEIYEKFIESELPKYGELYRKCMEKMIMNMGDIILDIPNIQDVFGKLLSFISELHLYESAVIETLQELVETQAKIIEEDDFF